MDTLSFPVKMRNEKISAIEKRLKSKPEQFWVSRGEKRALFLFQEMSKRVPAYKNWLKVNKVDPKKITSAKDFVNVPPVDKHSYLKKYSPKELSWDGDFSGKPLTFSSTSGTTGEPFYFPRTEAQDRQYALTAELYLRNNFKIHKKSTLYIDAFAMGPWIGGVFTYEAIRMVAERGYKLSIATPGTNSSEVVKTLKTIGNNFEQVIIGGYPPFVKDTIDYGIANGVDWSDYNLGIVFSAEGFNEEFRDYIYKNAKLKNIYTNTLNHYGTVDQGTHSHETPLSILIRRLIANNTQARSEFFPETNRLPTLTQYWPEQFYFESINGNLYCSAFSGYPLFRYDLKDRGGILSVDDIKPKFLKVDINFNNEIKKSAIKSTVWNLPFVYLFERSDMVVSWHGANIYPEHLRHAHLHPKVSKHLSGKFTMQIVWDKNHNPILEVNSELKPGTKITNKLAYDLQDSVIDSLLFKNSEYKILHGSYKEKMIPIVKLWKYNSEPHFKPGGKQKWVIKK